MDGFAFPVRVSSLRRVRHQQICCRSRCSQVRPSRNKANKVVEVEAKDDVETGLAGCPALPSTSNRAACGDVMGVLAKCSPTLLDNIIALALIRPHPRLHSCECFLGYDGGRSSSNPFAAVCLKSRLLFFAIVELSTFCFFLHPPSLHSAVPGVLLYLAVLLVSPPRSSAQQLSAQLI